MFVVQLQDLCLKNIAFNIIRHKMKMEKLRKRNQIRIRYEILKGLFSQDLLREIEFIHDNGETKTVEELHQFLKFLFCKELRRYGERVQKELKSNGNRVQKQCLKLLFNEYTLRLFYDGRRKTILREELIRIVLSQCKNLRTLKMNFYRIPGYMSNMPFGNTLIKADFLHSFINDAAMTNILLCCPNLQVFKASRVTSRYSFPYKLCPNYTTNEQYDINTCHGGCSGRRKNLKCLILDHSNISVIAAICALRHLPSLQIFTNNLSYFNSGNEIISLAVSELRKMSLQEEQAPVSLNLISVEFRSMQTLETIRDALDCCPRLKTFSFTFEPAKASFFSSCGLECLKEIHLEGAVDSHVTSREFNLFLRTQGHLLSSFSIDNTFSRYFDVSHISFILQQCRRLRRISFLNTSFTCSHRENYMFDAEIHENNLEEICFSFTTVIEDSLIRFFRNLFSVSPNLRQITISTDYWMAKKCFVPAMSRNRFTKLEKISFLNVNMENISVIPLIDHKTSLREIVLCHCGNAEEFSELHKEEAIKYNSSLVVIVREVRSIEVLYPYSLVYDE